ncbi:hypothetical protein EDD17DRAFT_1630804 [Pisolithus thermaeus]|nr:hypothetical protein EDD17DRAFT_1630804 [Pisolithus thermaeus]
MLQRLSHVNPRRTILQQEPIAGPSFTSAHNTGTVASGSTSEHPAAPHQANTTGLPSMWHDQTEILFAVDGRRLLTNRIRAILQNANTVRSHRVVLQHTDRVQSQQAIVEEMPSAGPSGTSADNTGIATSGSASEVPTASIPSPLPQEHNAASSLELANEEFHTPVNDSPPPPSLQEDSGTSSSSGNVNEEVQTPGNDSPPPYWRFTEHFD